MSERISPLRQRMTEDMTIRNLSPETQRSYIHAVKRCSLYWRSFASGRRPLAGDARGRRPAESGVQRCAGSIERCKMPMLRPTFWGPGARQKDGCGGNLREPWRGSGCRL